MSLKGFIKILEKRILPGLIMLIYPREEKVADLALVAKIDPSIRARFKVVFRSMKKILN